MHTPQLNTTRGLAWMAVVAGLVALSACNNRTDDGKTVGQKLDGAVATVEQKAEQAKDATANAAEKVGDKAKDMTITASVNAELARDSALSALKINVDTVDGQVTLRGTAPDSAAKDRATTLANSVSGVTKVDNQLTVGPRG